MALTQTDNKHHKEPQIAADMLADRKFTASHRSREPSPCLSLSSSVWAQSYKLRQRGKSGVPPGCGPGLSLQAASEGLPPGAQASCGLQLLPGIHSCGCRHDVSHSRRGASRRRRRCCRCCCCCRPHCCYAPGHTGVATLPTFRRGRLERRPHHALAFQPLQQGRL